MAAGSEPAISGFSQLGLRKISGDSVVIYGAVSLSYRKPREVELEGTTGDRDMRVGSRTAVVSLAERVLL